MRQDHAEFITGGIRADASLIALRAVQTGQIICMAVHASNWNDDHTSICPRRDAFRSLAGARGEIEKSLLSSCVNALMLPASHPDLSDLNQNGKNKDEQFLKMTAAPASAMLALAFVAMTTPASTAAPTSRPHAKLRL